MAEQQSSGIEAIPAIETDRLNLNFQSQSIYRDLSLTIRRNEFACFLGPSGCGKSTLLRIIGGLLGYDGAVDVLGRAVKGPSPDISIVFQKPNLLPWLTTEANLQLGAQIRRKPITPSITAAMVDVLGLKG